MIIGLRILDNCYVISQEFFSSSSLVCRRSKIELIDLWHSKLGDLNYRDLIKVANNEVMKKIPKLRKFSNPICGTCQKEK